MNEQDSIVKSFLRSFVKSFGTLFGIIIAIFFVGVFSPPESISDVELPVPLRPVAVGGECLSYNYKKNSDVFLVIPIDGVIGSSNLNEDIVRKQLTSAKEFINTNGRVKGIILAMNSPGGGVFESDSIYHAIMDFKKETKLDVITHVQGLCASGGFYIACATDRIIATDISLVGSVGVRSEYYNVVGLLDKIGVKAKTLTKGRDKDLMNPLRVWTDDEIKNADQLIGFFYRKFVDIVCSNRHVDKQILVQDIGANILTAPEALSIGFIDELGSFDKAVEYLKNKTNTSNCVLVQFKPKASLRDFLAEQTSMLLKATVDEISSTSSTSQISYK